MKPIEQAKEISNSLKGIKTSDDLISNTSFISQTVIEALESVLGSQRHLRSEFENETIEYWKNVKKESINIFNK